ncbi:hypothetical protein Glove_139g23 [Diversispora epigaea]|uniref:Protein kinase domain-containing protein n=1 Tax=Diversispora epigaea TaxID=1348612 RepID=A0A397IYM0_9GLOM|nr:hypothetical protein Glove_139g23 [Diversispora epigaea]
MNKVCSECNLEYNGYRCHSTHFKNNCQKWTSGNDAIDKFIQEAQLTTDNSIRVIEWIPYDKLQNVELIAKGGYGTIYYAMWVEGAINNWDNENQRWKKYGQLEVVLKKFDGIVDINEVFLNEMKILLRMRQKISSTTFYGITKDPGTREFMMVLQYFEGGSLRNHLNRNFDNIDWNDKLYFLKRLADEFLEIHNLDIIHRDFHPGNILKNNLKENYIHVTDFGLSKLITENIKDLQEETISGVLPYIAPEVLIGKEFTKAADVYSFAFVAYEIIIGIPPYHDVPHDKDLAFKICNGFRPKIPFHIPKLITQIIMRCWDARITHRPTFDELYNELNKYYWDYENNNNDDKEITIQIKKAEEEFSKNQATSTTPANYKTHPQAFYTSRLLNFSNLPTPKNRENFEKELKELTASFYRINASDDDDE